MVYLGSEMFTGIDSVTLVFLAHVAPRHSFGIEAKSETFLGQSDSAATRSDPIQHVVQAIFATIGSSSHFLTLIDDSFCKQCFCYT